MIRVLGRLILVPLGLLLGALAAMAVVLTLGLEHVTVLLSGQRGDLDRVEAVIDLAFGLFNIAAVATAVPALLVVIVGEVARIRSSLFYVAGGGGALALIPFLSRMGGATGEAMALGRVWVVLATAGFAGGLIYWLIAGRTA